MSGSGYYQSAESFKAANGYEIDGVWYPRVTSIVSIKAKPALYKYYAGLPDFATGEAIKAKSAEEGTLIHETIEHILRGERVAVPDMIRPAINAYFDFSKQHHVVAHKIEERVASKKHWYAGTLDVLAEVDGKLGILDIKTSMAIYRDYSIQTSAYVEALREDPTLPDLTRWILRIDQAQKCLICEASLRVKGGNVKIRGGKKSCNHRWSELRGEWELKEITTFSSDIRAFLACRDLWLWENDFWVDKIKKGQQVSPAISIQDNVA